MMCNFACTWEGTPHATVTWRCRASMYKCHALGLTNSPSCQPRGMVRDCQGRRLASTSRLDLCASSRGRGQPNTWPYVPSNRQIEMPTHQGHNTMITCSGPVAPSATSIHVTATCRGVLSHQTTSGNVRLISCGAGVSPSTVHDVARALEVASQYCRWLVCHPVPFGQPASPIDPTTGHGVDAYDDCHARRFLTDAILAAQTLGLSVIAYFTTGDDSLAQPLMPWLDRPVTGQPRFGLIPFRIIGTTPILPVRQRGDLPPP